MFHSRGIVQSKTFVPVGTSCVSSATCAPISRNVCRTPLPVMLRQMGNIFVASAKISSPISSVMSCPPRPPFRPFMNVTTGPTLALRLARRGNGECGHRRGVAVWLGVPQFSIKGAVRQKLFDMADTLVSRPFKFIQSQAGRTISHVELLGAHARIPPGLERRKFATDFFEAHAIRALVGTGIVRKFDRTCRHDGSHDLGQVSYPVVVCGLAHGECFIEHVIRRRLECSNESSRDIFNMYNGSPRRAV